MSATLPQDAANVIASALQPLIDGMRLEGSNYLIVSSGHAYLYFSRRPAYIR